MLHRDTLEVQLNETDLSKIIVLAQLIGDKYVIVTRVNEDQLDSMKNHDVFRNAEILTAPANDDFIAVSRLEVEQFDDLVALGSEDDDLEPDADIEAEETTEGFSA